MAGSIKRAGFLTGALLFFLLQAKMLGGEAIIQSEKVAHAGVCWVIADVGSTGAQALGANERQANLFGFILAMGAGLAKEAADSQGGSGFDSLDLLSDAIGSTGFLLFSGLRIQAREGGASMKWEW